MIAAVIAGEFDAVLSPQFWGWGDLHHEVASLAAGAWEDKEPPAIKGTGYCIAALEAALWTVAGAGDFRHAVLRAANLGDDAFHAWWVLPGQVLAVAVDVEHPYRLVQ